MREEIDLGNRKVTVIGTAHISEESKQEVRDTIREVQPDVVGVELDENRLKSLREDSGWKDLDISEAIKDGQAPLLSMNLLLSIYQRHLGLEEGMMPGQELLEAVEVAEEEGLDYQLIDRDINETLSRAFSQLSIWEKFKIMASFFIPGEEEVNIEDITQQNMLDTLVDELKDEYPTLDRVFLQERNTYMAEKLLEKDFDHAVAVVGAAHVDGMIDDLKRNAEYSVENKRGIPWSKIFSYGLPAAIIVGIAFSFYSGFSEGMTNLSVWFASNSVLAMIGAMIARSHILTWIVSFISSPFTSLNPMLPAGLVAAYTESKLHPPTVGELEDISKITRYRDLWGNQVGRIILTFLLVNLGSGGAAIFSGLFILVNSVLGI